MKSLGERNYVRVWGHIRLGLRILFCFAITLKDMELSRLCGKYPLE